MMRPIFENLFYDSDADRRRAQMERSVQAYADARLQEGLTKAHVLVGDMNEILATGDLQDPVVRSKLEYLDGEYQKTRGELMHVSERFKDKWGERVRPELLAKNRVVHSLPENLMAIRDSSQPGDQRIEEQPVMAETDMDASVSEEEDLREDEEGIDGGGFRVRSEEDAKAGRVARAPRASSGGEFADPDDPETQEALRMAEEYKRNPPPRPAWELELEQYERDHQRRMQETQQDIARAFQDMSRVMGQIARNNQSSGRGRQQSSTEPKLPYSIAPVGPSWDSERGWGPPGRKPLPSTGTGGSNRSSSNRTATQTQTPPTTSYNPPPGGSSSG
jgi:hypothetical protein